jgi:hypothetical protein
MRMTITAGLVVAAGLAGCAGGSGDHREILDLSTDFFDAMERRDVALAERLVVPEGVWVSVRPSAPGAPGTTGREIRSFSNADWMQGLAGREEEVRETFTGRPFIMVEGDVAMLWGEYAFEKDGALSHTGIDVITFVRTDDGWRIAGGAYNVVPAD